MIKAVLFDADGVILRKHKYFSERMQEEGKEIGIDDVLLFFKNEYKLVEVGKADLKTEVEKYLQKWKWDKSVDELLTYWFSGENEMEAGILETAARLRQKGVKCYVTSDHSRYRADDLMKRVGLDNHFDGSYFSGYVGYTKSDPKFFSHILSVLGLTPEEVAYWDDDPKNAAVARSMGINAYEYISYPSFQEEIKKVFE